MLWPVRLLVRFAVGVTVLAVLAGAVAWLRFDGEARSWAWWKPPAVLGISGRHYDRGADPPVSLAAASSRGAGTWTRVATEWPMAWGVWARKLPGYDPTVVYLCTSRNRCIDYALQGGP